MREILFRGKDKDTGEWVIGASFDKYNDDYMVIKSKEELGWIHHTVDPKTVGQYIGLEDKNGNKIFEGDYLKTIALTGEVYVQEVRWTNNFNIAGFRMVDSDEYWDDFDDYNGRIEVVGNIHDDDIEKIKEEVYNA